MARLHALLSADEQARAARFLSPVHRDRYAVAHGRLREILAERLEVAPEDLQFGQAEHGKPHLAGSHARSGLQFNLSHSGDRGLVGWAESLHLGVDIELWRPLGDEAALVRRFFSPAENAAYVALPEPERTQGFFECWTRKEAYIKAVGRGLGLPLDSFDVSFGPGRKAALLRPSAEVQGDRGWSLAAPSLGQGVSAAVILEADACHVLPEVLE
ncbi:MAG: 4'-phosphopantetheinyl transferase superfamily protein [Gammaproteobacteria bacterium]|nr:4'-phosphopantetheinyl transferase superfamily protein [Gammaproteobacteria bacterium]